MACHIVITCSLNQVPVSSALQFNNIVKEDEMVTLGARFSLVILTSHVGYRGMGMKISGDKLSLS